MKRIITFALILLNASLHAQEKQEHLLSQPKTTIFTSASSQQDIIDWWKESWILAPTQGLNITKFNLAQQKPNLIQESHAAYHFKSPHFATLIIEIPTDSYEMENGSIIGTACEDNVARLKINNSNYLSIDLNPFCSESYGDSEVSVTLYGVTPNAIPVVEIMTNGPACVPADLFIFDGSKNKFHLSAKKCGD